MSGDPTGPDPLEAIDLLLRDLRTARSGLSTREAARRLIVNGPNELTRLDRPGWVGQIVRQLVHPLALLLWFAAALAAAAGTPELAAAIVVVIVLNAVVAFAQEQQAERAVEALQAYLAVHATAFRDGRAQSIEARTLVPGDVVEIDEGDRISADARLLEGAVQVDQSMLSGESAPVWRRADSPTWSAALIDAPDLVFSGTSCTGGSARAVVVATGMRSEIGRIAALSQRAVREESPLERQVRRVAWLIAGIAISLGVLVLALGTLVAGLPLTDALQFAIGLLVANVPEGLLPTITLALAVGVRALSRRGALVKRLSAVETLGATSVICTDKTGTLTLNQMTVADVWTPDPGHGKRAALEAAATCTTASLASGGDPMELALLRAAGEQARTDRVRLYGFDPALRMMSTVQATPDGPTLSAKGAPEEVLRRSRWLATEGTRTELTTAARHQVEAAVAELARRGLRVIAVATRSLDAGAALPDDRDEAERDLQFVGLIALSDPPRREVRDAVRRCHEAGIRIIVLSGDGPETVAAISRDVGIVGSDAGVLSGAEIDRLSDDDLHGVLTGGHEILVARASPDTKLRIADALRAGGEIVAMTGDGVNDAPALRHADIGVAMGLSGTEVAREAATMVLTDDNFATIVAAVEEGRRVFDNVRKFIVYIFGHAPPEVVPFLVFALSGGAIPLPLTVMQILAIDLGTETLPAVALGREPAEPGIMQRRPRDRSQGVVDRALMFRAWVVIGLPSTLLVMGAYFAVLLEAGWGPGDDVSDSSVLHHAYVQATTMSFLAIVACQVGVAIAARTEHAALRDVGLTTNRLLLWGIAFEIVFSTLLVATPGVQGVFHMAAPEAWMVLLLVPMPVAVWGIDEFVRAARRRRPPGHIEGLAQNRNPAKGGSHAPPR